MTTEEYYNKKKYACFEYMVYKMKEWYEEDGRLDFFEKFSRYKAQKILFFCAAIKNPYSEDLLDVFDNFVALETGIVENDIYSAMVEDNFINLCFKERRISFKTSYFINKLSEEYKTKIDIAIGCLKVVNPKLIHYYDLDLGTIHKRWLCWKSAWMTAECLKKNFLNIPTELIRKNYPNFIL